MRKKCISLIGAYHAVHIRRGDKLSHEADKHDVNKYLSMLDFSSVKALYVATDDYKVIDEVKGWLKSYFR